MNIHLLKMEISCDEYIPDFLAGKLGVSYPYDDLDIAHKAANEMFSKFIKWLEDDPSCTSKAKYYTYVPNEINLASYVAYQVPLTWTCMIDGDSAWFKIKIDSSEVNKCPL